jgi:hypothetical protein
MSTILERVKTIGEYRDAVLVLISIDYLLGYFSWSYYAAQNDLGLVPALDTQFLVAGVLPTVILGIAIALVVAHLRFSRWTSTNPSDERYQWGARLGIVGIGLVAIGLVVGLFLEKPVSDWVRSGAVVGAYVMMLGAVLQGPRGDKLFRYYGLAVLWVVVVATPLVLFLFYFERVFPIVPAALGGPAPRCVHMDLASEGVSLETLTALVPLEGSTLSASASVRRTKDLDLLFAGPEFVMVRMSQQTPPGPVHALAKDMIRAMAPCRR